MGFPSGSDSKESACNAGDPGSVPRWGRSPGEGQGNPLQYSCLENLKDRGTWWATVHGVAKNQTQLSDEHFHFLSSELRVAIKAMKVEGTPPWEGFHAQRRQNTQASNFTIWVRGVFRPEDYLQLFL